MKFSRFSMMLLAATMLLGSCVKKAYDSPPDTSMVDPALPVQMKLKDLSTMGQNMPSLKGRVMGDTTIYGIVVADDRSGNYYKQIVIEDTSLGGIILYLDKTYLYNDYPVGRKVYVKLKGLTLINYNGAPEIVYSADAAGATTPIPSGMLSTYIVKGNYPDNTVKVQDVTIEQIKSNPNNYISTLVRLSGVQFATGSNAVSYAAPSAAASATNRVVEKCDHSASVLLRTSGYCNFQPYLTPNGNGTLTGICSIYSSTVQMYIRDTTDVVMTNSRCL